LLGEVRVLVALERAVLVLVDDQQVDQPDDVALAQARELRPDLAAELWVVEPDDQQLNRSHRHARAPFGLPTGHAEYTPAAVQWHPALSPSRSLRRRRGSRGSRRSCRPRLPPS